jgi:plasmid replication initiation protein
VESKKYMSMRNDVVEMGFRNMDPFTADLFCLVLRQVKKNIEDDKVSNKYVCEFSYSCLKRLLILDNHYTRNKTSKKIDDFRKTVLTTYYEFIDENTERYTVLFTQIENDKKNDILRIKINPDFYEFFLPRSKFTYFSLMEFVSLKTMYTKRLFIMLKQFRTTGYRRISVEAFREFMGADDKTYDDYAQLKRRVLLPAVNELVEKNYIRGLQIEEIKGNSGKKVEDLLFKYWPETLKVVND